MSEVKEKVLIAAPVHRILTDWLDANGFECLVREKITQAEAMVLVKDCIGIITSTRLQIDIKLIDAAPKLRWVGRMGSGMEVIDVRYAGAKGIQCYSSPEGNSNAVAEHVLGMLLALTKKIVVSNNEVKQGLWIRDANRGIELEGKTIAIIGFGNTGRAFARKLSVFGMTILIYDKYNCEQIPHYVESCNDFERIYKEADILSFHVPLQDDTVHYYNNVFAGRMEKPYILINTSRGAVVDTDTLLNELRNGRISGACLDVWEQEPIEKMDNVFREKLLDIAQMPQVIVTPHIAGYSHEAVYKMSKVLLDKIVMNR
ncbi:MAG: hydroxyacid dehydrogenase [Bacteroidetes bacterium]|nr:hydroxyacid dehydrogenase [Bacteroidota bacterium]